MWNALKSEQRVRGRNLEKNAPALVQSVQSLSPQARKLPENEARAVHREQEGKNGSVSSARISGDERGDAPAILNLR